MTTVGDIMTAGPCPEYTRERVTFLWGGRETLTPREITELDIPVVDRLWALIYCVLDDRQCRLFGCDCAERALTRDRDRGIETDPRGWAAVEVARRYAVGEATDEELSAARAAARNAAGAVAWDAAWAAAGSAAGSAARAAAGSTAGAAAWDAAWASAGSAAGYTAWASAGSAAGYTAWASAGSAAGSAAWASAGSAAWASAGFAARDAERAWQLARAWQYAEGEKP